ncbi:MAG: alpha/beta hydrolase [Lautropia sp.]
MSELLPCLERDVVPAPGAAPDAAVIWMHGLGADASDFDPVVPLLPLPEGSAIRFVFPNAPMRAITINGGMRMPGWYDIAGFGERDQDEAGIRESQRAVDALLAREVARGIASTRVVLAGFSQGGVVALQSGLRQALPLGGILALSTYLGLASSLRAEQTDANLNTPIFMTHGTQDAVIPIDLARRSRQTLQAHGHPVQWQEYPMGHEVCQAEIAAIGQWLGRVLAPLR